MNNKELFIAEDEDIYSEAFINETLNEQNIINKTIATTSFEKCNLSESNYNNVFFDKVIFSNV